MTEHTWILFALAGGFGLAQFVCGALTGRPVMRWLRDRRIAPALVTRDEGTPQV